jgi:NAD(P)-dependent dehydrogenase (short-subunit alcohol dehydrogenase family)
MNPAYDFRDQVALVTGAASGIGLSTATAFAESGAAVVLADYHERALEAATEKLVAAGHRAIGVTCDVSGVILTAMSEDMMETQADAMAEILKEQPIGRIGRADEVAAAVLWLCSPAASLVIAVALPVDGGFTAH